MNCTTCQQLMPDNARFCPGCGTAVILNACLKCGQQAAPIDAFCSGCGSCLKIKDAASSTTASLKHVKRKRAATATVEDKQMEKEKACKRAAASRELQKQKMQEEKERAENDESIFGLVKPLLLPNRKNCCTERFVVHAEELQRRTQEPESLGMQQLATLLQVPHNSAARELLKESLQKHNIVVEQKKRSGSLTSFTLISEAEISRLLSDWKAILANPEYLESRIIGEAVGETLKAADAGNAACKVSGAMHVLQTLKVILFDHTSTVDRLTHTFSGPTIAAVIDLLLDVLTNTSVTFRHDLNMASVI